jgi:hypothetical protein
MLEALRGDSRMSKVTTSSNEQSKSREEIAMTQFTTYSIESAPAASKPALEAVKKTFGFIPNLQANMAESLELLAGYSQLWALFFQDLAHPDGTASRLSNLQLRE